MWRVFVIGLLCLCIVGLGICVAQFSVAGIHTPWMLWMAALPAGLAWLCYATLKKFLRHTAPAPPPKQ